MARAVRCRPRWRRCVARPWRRPLHADAVPGAAGRVASACVVSTMTAYRFCPACAAALVPGTHGERPRLACAACGWVHWDNPTPVVAAIIELDGKLLLARNRAWPEKMFALVTGFLARAEHPA